MRAFLMSLAALVAITIVAAIGLNAVDMSAGEVYSSKNGNVRL